MPVNPPPRLPKPPLAPRPPREKAAACEWEAYHVRLRLFEDRKRRWERGCRRLRGELTMIDLLDEMSEICDTALDYDPLRKPHQPRTFDATGAASSLSGKFSYVPIPTGNPGTR